MYSGQSRTLTAAQLRQVQVNHILQCNQSLESGSRFQNIHQETSIPEITMHITTCMQVVCV